MATFCIVLEINRDVGRKSRFFNLTPLYITALGKTVANIFAVFSQPSQIYGVSGAVNACK